jgi:integrase
MAINKTAAGTYRVDYRDRDGKRYRKTFETSKAAIDYEKDMVAQVSKGEFVPPSDATVKDIADKWHKRKEDAGTYRFATLRNWRTHIDKYIAPSELFIDQWREAQQPDPIAPTLGELKIQEAGIEVVETAAATWAKMTSVNTANKVLTTLTAIFKLAQRYGPIQGRANVAELAERLKVSNEEDENEEVRPEEIYSEEELQKLINATAPGSLERILVMVPPLTGLRIGEVLALTWPALDLKANKLHVRLNLVDDDKKTGGRRLRAPKSKRSRRTLDLPQQLAHELRIWKLKCPPSESDLVFATIEGKPLHRKAASQMLDVAIVAAEIKRLTLHKLRHTFASLLLARGVSIPKVSYLLGHRDSNITLKVYAHFVEDKKNDVQELATSILSRVKEG